MKIGDLVKHSATILYGNGIAIVVGKDDKKKTSKIMGPQIRGFAMRADTSLEIISESR
tara:strand:+ start:1812 stop:1985 length:174 start_codon:yes stop_codon:yes gene_type:complete